MPELPKTGSHDRIPAGTPTGRASIFFLAILLPLTGVSCAWKKPAAPKPVELAPFTPADEDGGRKLATAFAEGFLAALKSGDFAVWKPVIPPSKADKLTPEFFRKIRTEVSEMLRTPAGAAYLGDLQKGEMRDHLWKLRFLKDGKVNEVVLQVRVVRTKGSGKPEISGFGIKRF